MTMETFNNKATREDNRIENSAGGRAQWVGGRLTCDTGRIIIGPVSRVSAADGRSLGAVNNSATLLFSALFRG